MTDQDRRVRRARAEWAAARACLRDRRAGLAACESHLARAFAALITDGDLLPEAHEVSTRARAGGDAPWSATLTRLADDLSALGAASPAATRIGRRRARRLQRALAPYLRRGRGRSARLWLIGAAVGLVLVALAVIASMRGGAVGASGFHASYFSRPDLRGAAVTRHDSRIDFTWLARAPLSGVPADQFSARWDGCFDLAKPERLTFRVGSDDGSRVWLDGKLLVDNWRDQGGNWMQRSLEVEPGSHHLRVEYYERGGDAFVVFELTRDGVPVGERFVHPPSSLEPEVRCEAR